MLRRLWVWIGKRKHWSPPVANEAVVTVRVEGPKEAVASLETVRAKAGELSAELERLNKLFGEALELARQVEAEQSASLDSDRRAQDGQARAV